MNDLDWMLELDGSERDEIDGWNELSAAQRDEIRRLDAEIFGLMADGLEPVEPSAGAKDTLMQQVAASVVTPFPVARKGPPRRWLLPIAAGLTAVALALAGSMFGTLRSQRAELAELRSQIEGYAELEASLSSVRENLALVSSRGVEVCPLRPMKATEGERGPYGLLFLAADHQHWYVKVAGLEAAPDRYYRVWFETEDGMVPAGDLLGQELELGAPTMPAGTKAVHVSIETNPDAQTPSDEIILFGDDMVRLL